MITERQLAVSSDTTLCDALRGGDQHAFAQLYDRHRHIALRIAMRMLGEASSAEDIVQSVFLTVWKSPPRLIDDSFTAWLAFVTRNRVRDALRAQVLRRQAEWPDELSEDTSIHDVVYARLEGRRVREALSTLPETQRSLIELGFLNERSHAELAQLTRLPLGTIKTRIRAGLHKLRATLDDELVASLPAADRSP